MRLDPATTALLVIDLQNDTVGPDGAFASSGAAAFAAWSIAAAVLAGRAGRDARPRPQLLFP